MSKKTVHFFAYIRSQHISSHPFRNNQATGGRDGQNKLIFVIIGHDRMERTNG